MQALILAAGLGQRMLPLTEGCNKTLLKVGGQTIIDRILGGLRLHGVTTVWIVTGYQAEQVREHVTAEHPDLEFHFVHNAHFDRTNNIYSLALAFERMPFDSDLLLIESDLVYEPAVLERVLGSGHENVALVDRYSPAMDGTVVALDADGVVTQVIPASQQGEGFDFGDKYKTLNIYRFSRQFCATTLRRLLTYYARVIDDSCYYELVLGMLVYMQQARIHAEVLHGERWSEVDDPNDMRLAELAFAPSSRADVLAGGGGSWGTAILDFAFTRNMHFPTSAMLSELGLRLPELLRTYGSAQAVVDRKVAWALRWDEARTHAVSGASQVHPWLRALWTGRRILMPGPTSGEYARSFPHADVYRDRPGISWAEVGEKAQDADVVVIVNPNNPTGTTLATEDVVAFARANRDKTVLVDESFIEFSGESSVGSRLSQEPLDNVVVLKSLSKSLGAPGARLGALLTGDRAVADHLREQMPAFALNTVAESFLELLLKHRAALESSFLATASDRADLTGRLGRLPLVDEVFTSGGNFVLVRLRASASEARDVADQLLERRMIRVKDVSARFGDGRGYWRVAVRTPDDHARLCAATDALTVRRRRGETPPSRAAATAGASR